MKEPVSMDLAPSYFHCEISRALLFPLRYQFLEILYATRYTNIIRDNVKNWFTTVVYILYY